MKKKSVPTTACLPWQDSLGMNDLSQRAGFVHWQCSECSLCCPLPEAEAGVQQGPGAGGHRGARADALVVHAGQRLLRAQHVQSVVQEPLCHAAQDALPLAGKDLTAVAFAARTLSEKENKMR